MDEMVGFAATLFIFTAAMVLTAIVFGFWVVVMTARGVFRGVGMLFGSRPTMRQNGQSVSGMLCRRERCQARNPGTARFCRRCGSPLITPARANVRRAAMW